MDEENSIAIIGIAGRFPGAENIQQFWDNLCKGVESISTFSLEELTSAGISKNLASSPGYVKARGVLEGIEYFDADFFGLTPREAQVIDPQHRLFLECSWEALENAGYCHSNYSGSIGVYGGCGMSSYFLNNIYPNQALKDSLGDYLLHIGNEKDFMTTRVSYKLNLKGPSLIIQTACSTSLVAICVACNHLLSYQCDMALAGGVSVSIPQVQGYRYLEGMIFSPDGHCKPFDAAAQGTVPGNGAGIVVLKRLQDAITDRDHIYAVIKGYGLNNDGMEKVGFSAPSVSGQAEAITSALAMAEVDPETIAYVEAHGTGTLLGDPIEIKALTQSFQTFTQKKEYCAIGSVKSNVGHLIEAAGVAGLIKTALSLHHRLLPPTLHFNIPNPHIDFPNGPFYINTTLKEWNSGLQAQHACVSSFGVGGTNAHVILGGKPRQTLSISLRRHQLLLLSAKTPKALKMMSERLGQHLQQNPSVLLADVAYTLQVGRKTFEERQVLICNNPKDASASLLSGKVMRSKVSSQPVVTFILANSGSQYVNMGRGLYQEELYYREVIDSCAILLKKDLGVDLRCVLYPSSEDVAIAEQQLNEPMIGQCALFVTEYALAKLWQEWGIHPQKIICHGIGEYVAGCLASVFTVEEALKLTVMRGRLMQKPENCAASLIEFSNVLKETKLMPPKVPYVSSLTGSPIRSEEATSPDYWIRQLQSSAEHPIEVQKIKNEQNQVFIQIGARETSNWSEVVFPSLPSKNQSEDDFEVILSALGKVWLAGANINWDNFCKSEQRLRVPLPTYPFEKKLFWIDPPSDARASYKSDAAESVGINSVGEIETSLLKIWQDLLGTESISIDDDFFKVGGDSLLAIQTVCRIQEKFKLSLQPQVLIEYPTVSRLAKVISEKLTIERSIVKEADLSPILVKLKEGDEKKKPLILIHPIGGYVFCYKQLAECIKYEGSIYGVQAPQFPGSLISLEEIASNYLRAIRSLQPEGPYFLLGASFGGLVAYEMARQLADSGQQVGLLAMLDIIQPTAASYKMSDGDVMLELLIELFEGKPLPSNYLEGLSSKEQVQRLMKSMRVEMLPFSEQQKIFEQVKMHWHALANYYPKPYPGKIIFFQAHDKFSRDKGISLASTWSDLAKEGVTSHEISGNHITMIEQPHVDKLAHVLDSYLTS